MASSPSGRNSPSPSESASDPPVDPASDVPTVPLTGQQTGPESQTIHGKPRLRVFVACIQCRSRKIRCDGGKPTCANCIKRAASKPDGTEIECSYDAVPKRRGPDKNPGARQRTVRRRPPPEQPPADSSLYTSVGTVAALDDRDGDQAQIASLASTSEQSTSQVAFGGPLTSQSGPLFLHPVLHTHHTLSETHPDSNQSQHELQPSGDQFFASQLSGSLTEITQQGQPHIPLLPEPGSSVSGREIESDAIAAMTGVVSNSPFFPPLPSTTSTTPGDPLLGRKRKERGEDDDGYDYSDNAAFRSMATGTSSPAGVEQNARQGAVELRQAMTALRFSTVASVGKFGHPQQEGKFSTVDFHPNIRPDALADHRVAFYHTGAGGSAQNLGPGSIPATFNVDGLGTEYEHQITPEPSLQYSRKTWWDNLLNTYSSDKELSAKQISEDLRSLFEVSQQWLGFINVPLFYATFHDPISRDAMQPSLVLAALSLSIYLKSSEAEMGAYGRKRALALRDMAQSALDASMNAGWIDLELGMAAWIIVQFEVSAHPLHSITRCESALQILESIIKITGYNSLDKDDPRVTRFNPSTVPVVPSESSSSTNPYSSIPISSAHAIINPPSRSTTQAHPNRDEHRSCSCNHVMLGHLNPSSNTLTPLWVTSPGWPKHWSTAEVRKEQARRLVWNSMTFATTMNGDAAASQRKQTFGFLTDCSNFALLFPGENLVGERAGKRTVWALYTRSMLLWNACIRMRYQQEAEDAVKAAFAVQAWIETVTIEDALNTHDCSAERALLFFGREYLFITRMCISWEFRRYIPSPQTGFNPIFNRAKAEEWLGHQASVARLLMQGLHTVTGMRQNLLAKRPSYVWWFMAQANRALTLWTCDESLSVALDVTLAFLPPIEYLARLWPCPVQRVKYSILRGRIAEACRSAGRAPPPNDDPLDLLAL